MKTKKQIAQKIEELDRESLSVWKERESHMVTRDDSGDWKKKQKIFNRRIKRITHQKAMLEWVIE